MAEEPQVVRGIHWREAFPFTHLFRAFRIATHPSKLVLAFLALLSLYLGGRVLDAVWMSKHLAVPGEVAAYQAARSPEQFIERRRELRERAVRAYVPIVQEVGRAKRTAEADTDNWHLQTKAENARKSAEEGSLTRHALYRIGKIREKAVEDAETAYKADLEKANALPQGTDAEKEARNKALEAAKEKRAQAIRAAYQQESDDVATVEAVRGIGLFRAFFDYQTSQINGVVDGVLGGNWLGGLTERDNRPAGVVKSTINFFTVAPSWALRHHTLYFFCFGILFLVVWSLFGGAIARIAAVHVADEGRKLSMRQGLSFAIGKFLSFLSAPLIPMVILVVLGLIVAVGGVLLNWPVTDILVGILFILPLLAGFVMTLVILGTAGGFNLMYPTIAVEGSDSFDAISRSFSYVYARPWRMLFYSAVSIAYGALCYLFVRLFIFLMLLLTWFFVGLLVFREAGNLENRWHAIMPQPQFLRLPYEAHTAALGWSGPVASFFVSFWNYIVIAMLGAFAISFYFSVNTIIYYLMRREVDATEMDDVYLEQPEEEFTETPASPATTTTAAATTTTTTTTTTTAAAGAAGATTDSSAPAAPASTTPATTEGSSGGDAAPASSGGGDAAAATTGATEASAGTAEAPAQASAESSSGSESASTPSTPAEPAGATATETPPATSPSSGDQPPPASDQPQQQPEQQS